MFLFFSVHYNIIRIYEAVTIFLKDGHINSEFCDTELIEELVDSYLDHLDRIKWARKGT